MTLYKYIQCEQGFSWSFILWDMLAIHTTTRGLENEVEKKNKIKEQRVDNKNPLFGRDRPGRASLFEI